MVFPGLNLSFEAPGASKQPNLFVFPASLAVGRCGVSVVYYIRTYVGVYVGTYVSLCIL